MILKVLVNSPILAVRIAFPAFLAVILPFLSTVNILVFELFQVKSEEAIFV